MQVLKTFFSRIGVTAIAGLFSFAMPADAQEFPSRPITIIVPFSAGGANDIIARLIGNGMSASLGTTVLVENRPGGGTAIGFNAFQRSSPDGYTLFSMNAVTASLPMFQKGYDANPIDLVEPISLLGVGNIALVSPGNRSFSTLPEFIAYAKAKPGIATYAAAGGLAEVLGRAIAIKSKIDATYVPYKGAADIVTDLIGGRVDVGLIGLVGLTDYIKRGELKLLAVTGESRNADYPQVPTVRETVPGSEAGYINYFSLVAPKGTPAEVIKVLNQAVRVAGSSEEYQKRLQESGTVATVSSPEELKKVLETISAWKAIFDEVSAGVPQ